MLSPPLLGSILNLDAICGRVETDAKQSLGDRSSVNTYVTSLLDDQESKQQKQLQQAIKTQEAALVSSRN